MTVIDADGHVTESAEQLVKYMDAPFRNRQLVFRMSRRSQPSAGTIGKTSWRLRNGASIYFTSCSADSVTWPSASITVIVTSFPLRVTGSGLLADHVE